MFWGRCKIWQSNISWEQLRLMGEKLWVQHRASRGQVQKGRNSAGSIFFAADLSIAKMGRLLRRAGNHTCCQAEAYVWFVVTQEAKERFRLRANLEERTARRQLAGGSLFINCSVSIVSECMHANFLLFFVVVCLLFFFSSYLFQFALTGNLACVPLALASLRITKLDRAFSNLI